MSLQAWFNGVWYGRAPPPWWLTPLSRAYGAAAGARRWLYAKRFRRPVAIARPVIVIGNLSVGGTGKTPLVCWLVTELEALGFKPGVVTRGFGGSVREPRRVMPADEVAAVGDETVLILRRTGVPVAVGRNRPAAARLLVGEGCDVVVSDDGLQHYALARDCELAVIDGWRELGNGRLLPAGPLREPASRLDAVDAVVINGGHAARPGALRMRLVATEAVAVKSGARRPLTDFRGAAVHALAGIGNPERFFDLLREFGIAASTRALDDHAPLSARDVAFGDARPVLMTEKDAVKCAAFADARHWYVPVTAGFDARDAAELLAVVTARIAERNRGLSRGSTIG